MTALKRRLLAEAPYIAAALPELPRLIHQRLSAPASASDEAIERLTSAQRTQNRLLTAAVLLLAALVGLVMWQMASG